MPTSYRYKPSSGFGSGNKNYNNPKDKEPPMWKTLLLVIGVVVLGLALLVGGFMLLSYLFDGK